MDIWKIELAGRILALKREEGCPSVLGKNHLQREGWRIFAEVGESESYMIGIVDGWHEKLKPRKHHRIWKRSSRREKKQGDNNPLTAEGEVRYRRVLGQLQRCLELICVFSFIPRAISV